MRLVCFVLLLFFLSITMTDQLCAQSQSRRAVIAASTLFDGKGNVLHNTRIVIQDGKIVAIDPKAAPVDYDLRGLTVLPGWIDAHAHVT